MVITANNNVLCTWKLLSISKCSRHKKEKVIMYMMAVLANIIVAMILQYISVLNQPSVHLKFIHCYVSNISEGQEKNKYWDEKSPEKLLFFSRIRTKCDPIFLKEIHDYIFINYRHNSIKIYIRLVLCTSSITQAPPTFSHSHHLFHTGLDKPHMNIRQSDLISAHSRYT